MGRPRPELGRDVRSTTFGNYVIFLRYADEDAPRSHLYNTSPMLCMARATWTLIFNTQMVTEPRAS
jgi:hypothetical protein